MWTLNGTFGEACALVQGFDAASNGGLLVGFAPWLRARTGDYAGGETEPQGGLVHFGQRYYDPQIGRWTQPDPLDQTGNLREGNRYAYVGGDPINASDPRGLHADYPIHRGSVASCRYYDWSWCPGYDGPSLVGSIAKTINRGCLILGAYRAGYATRALAQGARASAPGAAAGVACYLYSTSYAAAGGDL